MTEEDYRDSMVQAILTWLNASLGAARQLEAIDGNAIHILVALRTTEQAVKTYEKTLK